MFDDVHANVGNLQEKLCRRDVVVRPVIADSCQTLGPSLRDIFENFRAGVNKSVNETFPAGSIGSQYPVHAAIDITAPRCSEGAASDDGGGSTKSEDVVGPPADPKVIEL